MGNLLVTHPAHQVNQKRWEQHIRWYVSTSFVLLFLTGCDPPIPRDQSSQSNFNKPLRREIIGERLYQTYCSGCHGEKGKGDGMYSYTLNPPPADHTDSLHMNTLSYEYLFQIISNGGPSVGKSPEMPPWNVVLNKNDIENINIYIQTLRDGSQTRR